MQHKKEGHFSQKSVELIQFMKIKDSQAACKNRKFGHARGDCGFLCDGRCNIFDCAQAGKSVRAGAHLPGGVPSRHCLAADTLAGANGSPHGWDGALGSASRTCEECIKPHPLINDD